MTPFKKNAVSLLLSSRIIRSKQLGDLSVLCSTFLARSSGWKRSAGPRTRGEEVILIAILIRAYQRESKRKDIRYMHLRWISRSSRAVNMRQHWRQISSYRVELCAVFSSPWRMAKSLIRLGIAKICRADDSEWMGAFLGLNSGESKSRSIWRKAESPWCGLKRDGKK